MNIVSIRHKYGRQRGKAYLCYASLALVASLVTTGAGCGCLTSRADAAGQDWPAQGCMLSAVQQFDQRQPLWAGPRCDTATDMSGPPTPRPLALHLLPITCPVPLTCPRGASPPLKYVSGAPPLAPGLLTLQAASGPGDPGAEVQRRASAHTYGGGAVLHVRHAVQPPHVRGGRRLPRPAACAVPGPVG